LKHRIKPISHLKAHTGEVIRDLSELGEPLIITLHGEAAAVLQDIASYEQTQETLALLKMLAMSGKSLEEGRVRPADQAFADIRKRVKS
jgi:prevent-host-death family protein